MYHFIAFDNVWRRSCIHLRHIIPCEVIINIEEYICTLCFTVYFTTLYTILWYSFLFISTSNSRSLAIAPLAWGDIHRALRVAFPIPGQIQWLKRRECCDAVHRTTSYLFGFWAKENAMMMMYFVCPDFGAIRMWKYEDQLKSWLSWVHLTPTTLHPPKRKRVPTPRLFSQRASPGWSRAQLFSLAVHWVKGALSSFSTRTKFDPSSSSRWLSPLTHTNKDFKEWQILQKGTFLEDL